MLAAVVLCTFTGCLSTGAKARTERELSAALREVFEKENSVLRNGHIQTLSKPALHHEMRVRSVHYDTHRARILPLMRSLILQYKGDDAAFVAAVERMAFEEGCSSALNGVVRLYFHALDFDFSYTLRGPLNPKYRYSQTTRDDRTVEAGRRRTASSSSPRPKQQGSKTAHRLLSANRAWAGKQRLLGSVLNPTCQTSPRSPVVPC